MLIEKPEANSIYHEFVCGHTQGLCHLGILAGDMEAAITQARAAGFAIIQDSAGFEPAGERHHAYLNTEAEIGDTVELRALPKRRFSPESMPEYALIPGERRR